MREAWSVGTMRIYLVLPSPICYRVFIACYRVFTVMRMWYCVFIQCNCVIVC
jgi:hypothetical protein